MKRILYSFLLWLTDWDLQFARNTGRNPECIKNLSERVQEYDSTIFNIDHPLMGE